jgi:acyl-coenzyme A thioesterase 9
LKERRKSRALRSLSRVPPTTEEAQDLHSFYLNYGQENGSRSQTQEERVWIGDTKLEKTILMFPQERK